MMTSTAILIISCLGVAQGFFWSLLFLGKLKSSNKQDLILGLLLLAFSIRMLKSVLYVFEASTPLWVMNIGFAAHLFIGPLLLYYLWKDRVEISNKRLLLHALPGIAIVLLSPLLTLDSFWYLGGYTALLIQSMAYLIVSIWLISDKKLSDKQQSNWNLVLLAGVGIVLLVYFANYILRLLDYSWGPISFSIVIYGWSFFLVKHYRELHQLVLKENKYKNLEKVSQDRLTEVKNKIIDHFRDSKSYLDQEYTLSKFSDEIKESKHLISKVLNTEMEISFNEYINRYRVEEAIRLIEKSPYLTIASIAYDSGFNSLSTFNTAFKKIKGLTPSAYRSALSDQKEVVGLN